jgi:hypothetical protein
MKKLLNLFSAVLVCLVLNQTITFASSHREAPLIANDPLADNTDVYAFRSPCNDSMVVLIANYIPFEHPAGGPNYYNFGTDVRYEIHVDNDASKPGDEIIYRFTFASVNEDPTTFFNIRLGKQNLKTTYTLERSIDAGATFAPIITGGVVPPNNIGPRSITNATVGLGAPYYSSLATAAENVATTGERVFCGPRDDPFFVDLGGAFDVGNFRDSGRDGLAKFNVHSIVIQAPISTLQRNGKTAAQAVNILDSSFVIGVWANASRQEISTFDSTGGAPVGSGNWVQVSRLGMPLTNEVINPIGQKDKWNAANPSGDTAYGKYFNNPELALYMDDSAFGGAVPGLAALRIQTKSLGSYDFRNGKKGLFALKGTPALDGTALSEANFGKLLLPDSMSPRAVDLLPIFLTGVPNLPPYQLATGKPDGNPLAVGKPFINNFLPTLGDMLRLNMAVPVTSRTSADFNPLGIVQAAVLGLTDTRYNKSDTLQFIPNMDGFPNGRRLEDDVTTIELQAVSGVALAALGLWYDDYTVGTTSSPVTPNLASVLGFNAGVTKNDTAFRPCFPYLQTPWRGFIGAEYAGKEVILPIDMVSFVAEKVNQNVKLRWHASNEQNTDHYDIEQSLDGTKFTKVGTVMAINGKGSNTYEFTDLNPSLQKNNFYRIKQVDKDGMFSYSIIRLVKFRSETLITVTPNPATNFIKVYTKQLPLTVHLFDAGGRKMASQVITNGVGEFNISHFNRGSYIVVAESNGVRVETKKIIKQ